jgi:acetylornithine deacetylase/succinyl-diaminopimelate desuccinylase-like protein
MNAARSPELSTSTALEDFKTLLRFDTTNPPGNEMPAALWVMERLQSVGLTPELLVSEGRPNVVVRIEGDGTGGGPLLLAGHIDVVAVDREHWSFDPFAAVESAGYLYGRGTIDMKHMVIYCIYAVMRLAQTGRRPSRDIILAVVSDEEAGCTHGSKFLVDEYPEKVRATHMLGEFGGFSQDSRGLRFYPIQVAEKGVCQFHLRAKGSPGHGSIPIADNAVARLGRAVDLLGRTRLPRHPTRTVQASIRAMAAAQPAVVAAIFRQSLNPLVGDLILDRVLPDRSVADTLSACMRNTATPTMLRAGAQKNVIPSDAVATIDGRTLPGQTAEDLLREVRAVIGDGYETEIITWRPGRENTDVERDPMYRAICDNVRLSDPVGLPVPYMITGFTDAQQFGRLGMQCYGYAPVRYPEADNVKFARLIHGHDERIHVEGFRWGVTSFLQLLSTLTGCSLVDGWS